MYLPTRVKSGSSRFTCVLYAGLAKGGVFNSKSGCVLYADATYTRVYTVLVMNMTTTINILPIPIIMLQQLFLIFHIHFCPLKPVCYRYFTTILSSALDIIIYPLSWRSKLNENVCSNLSMARYVYMLYVLMDEIIKSQYYIILYNMLHIHLRCEMSAHIISSILGYLKYLLNYGYV